MASQFDDIEKRIIERLEKVNRKALAALSTSIIVESPVDKGAFIGSWYFQTGSAPTKLGSSGRDSVGEMLVSVNKVDYGQVGWLINNQPYSVKLEYGHSQKNSAMVRRNTANWQKFVDKAAKAN